MNDKSREKPTAIRAKLKYPSIESFVVKYSQNISKYGIFFKTSKPKPEGTAVKFELKIADGTIVIRGMGEVAWTRESEEDGKPPGMGIKFSKLDSNSRETIKKVLHYKANSSISAPSRYSEAPPPMEEETDEPAENEEVAAPAVEKPEKLVSSSLEPASKPAASEKRRKVRRKRKSAKADGVNLGNVDDMLANISSGSGGKRRVKRGSKPKKSSDKKAEAEALASAQAEASAEAEEKARLESESKAKAAAEAEAKSIAAAETEEKARAEAARMAREAEAEKVRLEAEERARLKAEEELKAAEEAEEEDRREAEVKAQAAAEAAEKTRLEVEAKNRAAEEAEERARIEAEERALALQEAEEKALQAKIAEKEAQKKAEEKLKAEQLKKSTIEADEDEIDDVIAAFDAIQMPDENPVVDDSMDENSLFGDDEDDSDNGFEDDLVVDDDIVVVDDDATAGINDLINEEIAGGDLLDELEPETNEVPLPQLDEDSLFEDAEDEGAEDTTLTEPVLDESMELDFDAEQDELEEDLFDDVEMLGEDDEADNSSDGDAGFIDADQYMVEEDDDEKTLEISAVDDEDFDEFGDIEEFEDLEDFDREDPIDNLIDGVSSDSMVPEAANLEPLLADGTVDNALDDIFEGEAEVEDQPKPRSEREERLERISQAPDFLPDDALPDELAAHVTARKSLPPPAMEPQGQPDQAQPQADGKKKGFFGKFFGK